MIRIISDCTRLLTHHWVSYTDVCSKSIAISELQALPQISSQQIIPHIRLKRICALLPSLQVNAFAIAVKRSGCTYLMLQERGLDKIVLPLSGLVSWVAILSGALMSLHVLGINIQPLLTVGGVSGVVVGLSAQSVVTNLISGVNLVSLSTALAFVSKRCQQQADAGLLIVV